MGLSIYFKKAKVVDKNLSVDDIAKINKCLKDNKEVEGIDPKVVEKYKKLRKTTYYSWDQELEFPLYSFVENIYCSYDWTLLDWILRVWQNGKDESKHYEITRDMLERFRDVIESNLWHLNRFTSRAILQYKEFDKEKGRKVEQGIALSKTELYYRSKICNEFFPDLSCFNSSKPEELRIPHINSLYRHNCQILGMINKMIFEVDFETEKLFYYSSY